MKIPSSETRVAALYALFGSLWILLSDRLLAALVTDAATLTTMQTYKGWAFVATSALLIFALMRRELVLRRMAEDKVSRSEERYSLLVEHSLDAILISSPGGSIDSANPAASRLFGWSEAQLKKFGRKGIIEPTDPRLEAALKERARTGAFHGELTFLHSNGTKFPGEVSTAIFTDHDGNERTSMIIRDISERKQVEEKLRDSEARFREAIEFLPIPIGLADRQGHIIHFNQKFTECYGYTIQDLPTLDDWMTRAYPDPEYREVVRANWQRRISGSFSEGATTDIREFKVTCKNREQRDVEIIARGIDGLIVASFNDITERKQAEQALVHSEQRFRALIENGLDQISLMDPRGELIWESPSATRTLGYIENTHIQHDLFELMHPDDRAWTREQWLQLLQEQGGRRDAFFRLHHADGSWRWIEAIVSNLLHEPAVNALVVNYRDVTQRKQAEEALRESERQMRALVTSLDDIVFEFDEHGTYLNVWTANESLLARPRKELLGRRIDEILGSENGRPFTEAVKRVAASGRTESIEYPLDVMGGRRWFSAHINSILSESESSRTVSMVIRDVTKRKLAEEKLLESENRLQLALEAAQFGVWERNLETGAIFWSQGSHDLTGLNDFDNTLEGFTSRVHPEDRAQLLQASQRAIEEGTPFIFEFRWLHPEGKTKWLRDYGKAEYGEDGRPLHLVGTVEDITERKQAEQELQHRNEDLLLINVLNDAANRGDDIEKIVEVFARETRDVFACQDVAVYLLSPDGKYVEMQSTTISRRLADSIEKLIGRPIPRIRIPVRDGSYFSSIMKNEQGVITSDPKVIQQWIEEFTETTFLPAVFRSAIKRIVPQIYRTLNIGSTISVPLISSGRAIGILDMSSRGHLTEEDLKRIRNISYQITAILLRKQAEKEVQLQLRRMKAMSEIDRAISSSLDMRVSLEILISEVLSQLGVHAASVLLLNASSNYLEYVAGKGFRTSGIRQTHLRLGEGLAGHVGLERKILHIPVLAEAKQLKRAQALRNEEFVEYVGVPLVAKGVLKGVLEIFHRAPLNPDAEWLSYLETLGRQAAIAIDNAQLFESTQRSNLELVTAYDATIAGWSQAMDLRDRETEGHTRRVTELTLELAARMGFRDQDLVHIRRGALLHDMGKLGVPDHVLHKPGPLTEAEWVIMRQHPAYAFEMLNSIAYLKPALDIPYCHHEKWDGTGYPRGLKGEEIPLPARLFAVVDVWDAVTSDRPYRAAWSRKKALDYIREQSGKHFDPKTVAVFIRLVTKQ